MRDFCVATGLRMNIEETGGTVIAGTAAVHLAVATPSTRLHTVVPAHGGYVFQQGKALLSDAVGLGVYPSLSKNSSYSPIFSRFLDFNISKKACLTHGIGYIFLFPNF